MLLMLVYFLCEEVHFQFKFPVSYKWNLTNFLVGATNIPDPVLRNACYGGIWKTYLGDFLKKKKFKECPRDLLIRAKH